MVANNVVRRAPALNPVETGSAGTLCDLLGLAQVRQPMLDTVPGDSEVWWEPKDGKPGRGRLTVVYESHGSRHEARVVTSATLPARPDRSPHLPGDGTSVLALTCNYCTRKEPLAWCQHIRRVVASRMDRTAVQEWATAEPGGARGPEPVVLVPLTPSERVYALAKVSPVEGGGGAMWIDVHVDSVWHRAGVLGGSVTGPPGLIDIRSVLGQFLTGAMSTPGMPHAPRADESTFANRFHMTMTGSTSSEVGMKAMLAEDSPVF